MTAQLAPSASPFITVGLAQINNSFSGQNYLPYSVAVLEAYVRRNAAAPERYAFVEPLYKRLPVRDAVAAFRDCDVVGFSTYVWNANISLEIARRLKAERPDMLIVFGGPQVPEDSGDFLRAHPFIDLVIHNEGERSFQALLEMLPERDFAAVPGASFLDADGGLVDVPPLPRLRDLSELPSPFLDGSFDALMAAHPDETWIGLWETNRGCPFQCTYCDWGSATAAKVTKFEMDRLKREAQWFADHRIEFIFCCDANFGILKRDVELANHVAEIKRATGYPRALSVQNTKNATERAYETQKILSDAGLNKGVALSMQSLDRQALTNIKRDNISLDTYLELQRRFTADGVETFSDLILGLPGETYDSFVDGIAALIDGGQHNRVQFNNLTILPNAQMAAADYRDRFGLVTVETEITNIHGARHHLDDDVAETQEMVVGTASMPPDAWRRARAVAWMAALTHFDKLLQIPFILAHEQGGVPYRALLERFMVADAATTPLIAEIRDFFLTEAARIQAGEPEYAYSADWLGIYWPADEYVFIRLTAEGRLDAFYAEARTLMMEAVRGHDLPDGLLDDALRINRALLKQPFVSDTLRVPLDYDVIAFWRGARVGAAPPLARGPVVMEIDRGAETWTDFQTWCREVVWWGNKKGAYLYGARPLHTEIAGHY